VHAWARGALAAAARGISSDTAAVFAADADVAVSAPVEALRGPEEVEARFLRPLRTALEGCHRRDDIFIGGRNRRAEGGTWVASVTHYVGNFVRPLFGIAPSDRLVFLRAGEFHRVEDGRIVKSRIILDLLDLMRQAGRLPVPADLGTEMLFPAPATHDGVLPAAGDGEGSLDRVEAMLSDLQDYDPATVTSPNQTGEGGHWRDDMMWYGPGGVGSSYRWDGFVKDHRRPFLAAFPDRRGGNHYCRIGDGPYAAVSGWPSMTMTHRGPYLGVPATGRALTLRVMDFYRLDEGRIAENWVLLDYVDLLRQMGVDVLGRSGA
jgi:predicted ester cyclase